MRAAVGSTHLVVGAGAHRCAFPLDVVVETMRPLPVRPVAGTAACVRGLATVRGRAVPVVDLGAFLAGPGGPAARWVTIRVGSRCVAVAVGFVEGLVALSPADLEALPPLVSGARPGVAEALAEVDGDWMVVVQGARLVEAGAEVADRDGGPP